MINDLLASLVLVLPLHHFALSVLIAAEIVGLLQPAIRIDKLLICCTEHANTTYLVVERMSSVQITDVNN